MVGTMFNLFYYTAVVFIWGSTWLAITYQLGPVPPEVSIAYRFLLASFILLVYCRLSGRPMRFSLAEHRWMALQGVFLFALNYWLFYVAELWVTSGLVAVIFALMVPMNMLNGRLFLKLPLRPSVFTGGAIGLFGIGLVFWPELKNLSLESMTFMGIGFSLVATYSASLGNIISARNQKAGIPVIQANAFGMGYGGAVMLGWSVLSGAPLAPAWTAPYLASLFYLSIFGSILAFGAYLTLIGRIGADRAAYSTLLFPIVALALSAAFEEYQWTAQATLGIALVLVGNLLVLPNPLTRRLRQVQTSSAA